jgi:hypothetical protein
MQTIATENDILTLKYYIVLFAIVPVLKDKKIGRIVARSKKIVYTEHI